MGKYQPKPKWNQQNRRAGNLTRMGFANYAEYLTSDLWASVRKAVLERDKWMCKACGCRATQVHHRRYVTKALTGENLGLLSSLCAACHRHIEWDGTKKMTIGGANRRLNERVREYRRKKSGA